MGSCCICCDKKLGMFSACFELEEKSNIYLCDECNLLVSEQMNILRETKKIKELDDIFSSVTKAISDFNFSDEGKDYVLKHAEKVKETQSIHILNTDEEELVKKKERDLEEKRRLEEKIRNFKMTTGYDFEGYTITEYYGVVSGEVVLGTGFLAELDAWSADFFGVESNAFADKMRRAKDAAKQQLMYQAITIGGNAVIGIDFDYLTFNSNMVGVSANGTAVLIKKKE